jgi:hypothetical protein
VYISFSILGVFEDLFFFFSFSYLQLLLVFHDFRLLKVILYFNDKQCTCKGCFGKQLTTAVKQRERQLYILQCIESQVTGTKVSTYALSNVRWRCSKSIHIHVTHMSGINGPHLIFLYYFTFFNSLSNLRAHTSVVAFEKNGKCVSVCNGYLVLY